MTPNNAILITGCSSGIGRCLAVGLKTRGYRVFASVRQEKDLVGLAALGLETLRLDLASSASIRAAVDDVLTRTGGQLFALINNGAYGQPGAVEDLSRALLREQFETSAQCPRRTLLRQWAQVAAVNPVSLSATTAVSERAAPRDPAAICSAHTNSSAGYCRCSAPRGAGASSRSVRYWGW